MEHAKHIAGIEQKMYNQYVVWLSDHHVQLSHMVTVIFWFESAFYLEQMQPWTASCPENWSFQ